MRKGLVMVRRPVFVPESDKPYVSEISLDFEYFPGSSIQQKQRSVASLHAAYVDRFPSSRVLEVSSRSKRDIGVQWLFRVECGWRRLGLLR